MYEITWLLLPNLQQCLVQRDFAFIFINFDSFSRLVIEDIIAVWIHGTLVDKGVEIIRVYLSSRFLSTGGRNILIKRASALDHHSIINGEDNDDDEDEPFISPSSWCQPVICQLEILLAKNDNTSASNLFLASKKLKNLIIPFQSKNACIYIKILS